MVDKIANTPDSGADPAWGRSWLPLVVGLSLLAAALLPLVFELAREIPPNYGCGEEPSAGLERRVAEYREGYIALHVVAFVAALATLASLSVARRRRSGRPGMGKATGIVLALLVIFVVAGLVSEEARVGFFLVIFPAIALLWISEQLGPEGTAIVAMALLAGLGAWIVPAARRGGALLAASTTCWTLLLLIPAHALIVSEQGSGPILC